MAERTGEIAILTIHRHLPPLTRSLFFRVVSRGSDSNRASRSLVDLSADHNVEIARSYRFRGIRFGRRRRRRRLVSFRAGLRFRVLYIAIR